MIRPFLGNFVLPILFLFQIIRANSFPDQGRSKGNGHKHLFPFSAGPLSLQNDQQPPPPPLLPPLIRPGGGIPRPGQLDPGGNEPPIVAGIAPGF